MARNRSAPTTAIDKALRGMFEALASRRVPDHLRSLMDQLDDDGRRAEPSKRARRGH